MHFIKENVKLIVVTLPFNKPFSAAFFFFYHKRAPSHSFITEIKNVWSCTRKLWLCNCVSKVTQARCRKKALINKGWRVCTLTPSLALLNLTDTHRQLLWRWVNGHRDRVFPAGLCRWGLSALFSPEGLGLSFCSGMAEFNWRTLMRSWIAELLMPWLALKMGGRERRAGVCICVYVSSSHCRHPSRCQQIYSWDPSSLFMSCLIYKIIGNNNFRLILG